MSSTFLPLLADRVLNRPLMIHPDKAALILSVLDGRILPQAAIAPTPPATPDASRFVGRHRRPSGEGRISRANGPTALVTIDGSLVNRGAWLEANSGLTSYEGIAAQIDDAASDTAIRSIVLDLNSPGGEATGMATLATLIRKVGREKRIVAVVNDVAASAAYGIASAAHEIVISPTSIVGSIGIVMLHLDRSGEMQAKGIRPTLIHAGAHKVDGNPFEPLPENVRADMQREVGAFYDQFLDVVAQGRGRRLSAAAARATEARTFFGKDAIAAGLADRMASLGDVLAELNRPRGKATPTTKGTSKVYPNEHDPAAIARAERGRIKAILTLPEAKGRESSALAFACDSDMSADAAKAALAGIPAANGAASAPTVPTIAQRAAEQVEVGANGRPANAAPGTVKAGWAKAFGRLEEDKGR